MEFVGVEKTQKRRGLKKVCPHFPHPLFFFCNSPLLNGLPFNKLGNDQSGKSAD